MVCFNQTSIPYKPELNGEENSKFMEFIKNNGILCESKLLSVFSGMTKSHWMKNCKECKYPINEFSFSYFIDQNMYLDEIKEGSKFSEVLSKNFAKTNIIINCPYCKKENICEEETKIIKLPDVLIFTLERYQGKNNNIKIEPDDKIEMKYYVDPSLNSIKTEYELFAINIRFGETQNSGHEICQVKRKNKWFEFNDTDRYPKTKDYNNYSYGLFYCIKEDS